MFLHSGGLPQLLSPDCYFDPSHYESERTGLFLPAWHSMATTAELSRPGDFITFDLCGSPVQLRNDAGVWRAFSNVCAHRHCLLTGMARGHSEKLRCQYHGWEYDCEGRTRHIPQAKNFAPFDAGRPSLATHRVERCGQLLFVAPRDDSPPLNEFLGENYAVLQAAFGDAWRLTWSSEVELPVNWKIPIENSVEGYHIPAVHPDTFKVAPTADRTTHVLAERFTTYRTPNVEPSLFEKGLFAVEKQVMRILRREASHSYAQYHLFSNLLVSSSDMLSLAIAVMPTAVKRTQLRIRLFTYRGTTPSRTARIVSAVWSQLNRLFTKMVLKEDFAIYEAVQRGLETSTQSGRLGAIEERIYAFQRFVHEHCVNSLAARES